MKFKYFRLGLLLILALEVSVLAKNTFQIKKTVPSAQNPSAISRGYPLSNKPIPIPSIDTVTPMQTDYINSAIGFTISIPPNWRIPAFDNSDPHFESCDSSICSPIMEIEKNDGTSGGSAQKAFDYDRKYALNPTLFSNLVPGALVVKSVPNIPAEGWLLEYEVFFKDSDKALVIYSKTAGIESHILPTLSVYP